MCVFSIAMFDYRKVHRVKIVPSFKGGVFPAGVVELQVSQQDEVLVLDYIMDIPSGHLT